MKLSISFLIALIATLFVATVILYWQVERLEDNMRDLQCRHVLFEDYSTLHKDGELTARCMGR